MNDTNTNTNEYNSNLIIKEGISSSDSENYIGSLKSKGSSSELMNMSMKSNRVLRVFVLSISLLLILAICTSFAMSFSYKRISEFFYSYNNQVIKFQMNRIILYTLYFYFIINKSIYFLSVYLFTDKYLVEAIYKFGKSVLVMNDILMLSNILIGTFVNRVEIMTVISVILSSFELIGQIYCYSVFNERRNLTWRIQLCLFMYSVSRLVFLSFQITYSICFYLYNINHFIEENIILITISSDVLMCIIGILLITYFTDIFFLAFYMYINLGLILGNYNYGLSDKELVAYTVLSSFSLLCSIYSIIKYKSLIWGESSINDEFINSMRPIFKMSVSTA